MHFCVVQIASMTYFVEKDENGWTFIDSFWYSLMTLTTVGYELHPKSTSGKVAAILCEYFCGKIFSTDFSWLVACVPCLEFLYWLYHFQLLSTVFQPSTKTGSVSSGPLSRELVTSIQVMEKWSCSEKNWKTESISRESSQQQRSRWTYQEKAIISATYQRINL